MKRTRFGRKCNYQTIALIGNAGATLGGGIVRILHRCGLASYERVLAIVKGAGVCVGQAEVSSARNAPVEGECRSVVVARGCTLEFINRPELRDRAAQRIDARRPGTF